MREPAIGTYDDAAGVSHIVAVRQNGDGIWHVLDLDVDADTAHVIDSLTDKQDGRLQAEAIARDYLANLEDSQQRAGREPTDAISEHGGRDDHSHRRPRTGSRKHPARKAALSDQAR